jgi:hypothetical protein
MLYLQLIILSVRDDVFIDNETLLMSDFINLKIKPTQSFKCVYRDKMCVYVFIEMSIHIYMSIYIYNILKKKELSSHIELLNLN